MRRPRKLSLRPQSAAIKRLRFNRYKKEAVKKLRALLAQARTAQRHLQATAAEAAAVLRKLDKVSAERTGFPRVDLARALDEIAIVLHDTKLLTPEGGRR